MLILVRKPGQSIKIGPDTWVKVTEVHGDRVSLGVSAPRDVAVDRSEVAERKEREAEKS